MRVEVAEVMVGRASSLICRMALGAMETGVDVPGADWGGLDGILSELPHADMNSKAQLLYALSSILSCVATSITYPAVHHSVSAWIKISDVWELYELIFKELRHHTFFLFDPSHSISDHVEEGGSADLDHARVVNLEIVSQTLRCSIRLLRLLDFFDRNASLAATKELDGILRQLCSPGRLFDLLRFRRVFHSKEERCQTNPQCNEDGIWGESDEEPRGAYKQCFDSPASQRVFWKVCMTHLVATSSRRRMEIIFTLLEVYTDEFLLEPGLIARLVESREEKRWSSECDQLTAIRDAEASLEAAFVHVLLSLQTLSRCDASCCRARQRWLIVRNLSLPASLMLLERFSAEEIPLVYGTQVVCYLSRIVRDALYRSPSARRDAYKVMASRTRNTRRDYWAGGVDWAYCFQERSSNGEEAEANASCAHFHDEDFLHSGITEKFMSILEQALLMYLKIYLASDTCAANNTELPSFNGSVLKSRLWEHTSLHFRGQSLRDYQHATGAASLQDESRHKCDYSDREFGWCRCQCCTSSEILVDTQYAQSEVGWDRSGTSDNHLPRHDGHTGVRCFPMNGGDGFYANEEEAEDGVSGFVVALLQLMSCVLDRLSAEVSLLFPWMPEPLEDHRRFSDGQSMPFRQSDYKSDFDKILDCKGLRLTSCLSAVSGGLCAVGEEGVLSREHYRDPELRPGGQRRPLHDFAGHAVVFFANVLRCEAQKGRPDAILERYFHLLESLVALLLSLDERIERGQPFAADHCDSPACRCLLSDNVSSRRATLDVRFHGGECGVCCGCRDNVLQQLPHEISSARFLDQMAHCLQGILDDLSGQQRSMPEFLLLFAFKQVSKRDGLRIVTIVFISFLHQQVDIEQVIGQSRTDSVWSGGLVMQVLKLAITEPTRSCSLLTFIGYMIDILDDVPPIVPSLSLSEIADLIWWYENVAHSLTLASELAVSEHDKFVKIGREHFFCWISKMGDGINRLLTEGAAAARWLLDLSNSMPESAWQELTGEAAWQTTAEANEISGHCLPKEALKDAGNVAKCSGFLSQMDTLRKAVKTLGNIGESFLGSEFANWLDKGRAFFEDLSHLLAGKKLPGPQWSEYVPLFDGQDKCVLQPHPSPITSVILDPEFDGGNSQKGDGQPHVDREHAEVAVEDEVQEAHGGSPACLSTTTGDEVQMQERPSACAVQTVEFDKKFQTHRGFSDGAIQTQEGSDPLVEEQEGCPCKEGIGDAADSGTSATECPIPLPSAVEDKKQPKSVAPAISTEGWVEGGTGECMEEVGTSAENLSLHVVQRKRSSISTSAIIKRLLHKPMRSTRSIAQDFDHRPGIGPIEMPNTPEERVSIEDFLEDDDGRSRCLSPNSTNPYIDYQSSKYPSEESFDDLKDFIVPKKGRNYSVWWERRQRLRRRARNKRILPRIREKKELLLLFGDVKFRGGGMDKSGGLDTGGV